MQPFGRPWQGSEGSPEMETGKSFISPAVPALLEATEVLKSSFEKSVHNVSTKEFTLIFAPRLDRFVARF